MFVDSLGSELVLKLRIIAFSSYDSSSGPLLQELGWDGLSIRRIKLLAIEMFKVYNNICQLNTYAKHFWKWGPPVILGAPLLDFNCLFPKPITWQKRSDLRWKQGPAEKVVGLHELKRSVWRNRLFLFNIFATENRIDYDSFTFKTLSNLKLLSQLTQARTVKFNHHADFSQGLRGVNNNFLTFSY